MKILILKTIQFLRDKNFIYKLLIFNFVLRFAVAVFSTLGNDEVYYTLYAKYPDYGYFDHPPMVGWFIWLTTFGMHCISEFFVRFSSLVFGSFNIFLVYLIGENLRNEISGNLAALLASASFYVSVISGVFILPDTPQSIFWMLSLWIFIKFLDKKTNSLLILFGVFVGFALLSKYHAVYLWLGAGLYALFFDRKILLKPAFWLSICISFLIFAPNIYWNLHSTYSGIGYHEGRVGSGSLLPNFKFFFPELFGQIFYNNPFNAFLVISALVLLKKNTSAYLNSKIKFLLLTGLPLVFTTLALAMYNKTLPHWSGPAWFSLILISAFVFSDQQNLKFKKLIFSLKGSMILFSTVIILGLFQIGSGFILGNPNAETEKLGKDDFTVDLSQWRKIGEELKKEIPENSVIITHNWFPAAHLTHYFGDENKVKVYVFGSSDKQHQYLKINKDLGEISPQQNVYYVSVSHYYQEPPTELTDFFENISSRKTLSITQFGRKKVNVFIWKLNGLKRNLVFAPNIEK